MGFTRPKYNNLDTSKFEIDDPITELNTGVNDTDPSNSDIGFIFNRGSNGTNTALIWDKSANSFRLGFTDATGDDSGDIVFLANTDLQVATMTANNLVASNIVYPTTDGTTGQILTTDGNGTLSFTNLSQQTIEWGSVIGTLSNQIDLQNELDAKISNTDNIIGGVY